MAFKAAATAELGLLGSHATLKEPHLDFFNYDSQRTVAEHAAGQKLAVRIKHKKEIATDANSAKLPELQFEGNNSTTCSLTNVKDPTEPQEVATMRYVDANLKGCLLYTSPSPRDA